MLKKINKNFRLHLIVWSVYIVYEVFITGLINDSFGKPGVYVIVYFINITSFYVFAYCLNRSISIKKPSIRILTITLTIAILLVGYTLFSFGIRTAFVKLNFLQNDTPMHLSLSFMLACIWRALYFIGFATGYVFIMKSFRNRKRAEELERKNLLAKIDNQMLENDLINSQNNFLRSQINPHFLFNTLNFIYNDARKKAPIAGEAIMSLAEMMRYALKRPEVSELVPLEEEIEQIEHLINLHKLRTANSINLNLCVEGDLSGVKFPPLILLTLVENMFKHGNVSHSAQQALISIVFQDDVLTIQTQNIINNIKAKESTSVGVENIHKRLLNFYKNRFTFTHETDQRNRYISKIQLKLATLKF